MDRRDFIAVSVWPLLSGSAIGGPAQQPTIVVLGDSLSAEYGLARGTGWVALLMQRLDKEAISATVVNASISGDTTAGGRSRLPALLKTHKPTHVVIELGANDALRGLPLASTEDNLIAMLTQAKAMGAQVLLIGMQVPPNYGADYASRFANLFARIAQAHDTALVPFLLKAVADGPQPQRWFQSDGIHPSAEAHPIMLDNVWQHLRPMLVAETTP